MMLRCFGGPLDGRRSDEPDDRLRHGAIVEFNIQPEPTTAQRYLVRDDIPLATQTIERTRYRVHVLSMPVAGHLRSWRCLVHETLTDEEFMDQLVR